MGASLRLVLTQSQTRGRQAPSSTGGAVLARPVPSWELGTPSLPSSCWSEDDIRFGKCLLRGGHRQALVSMGRASTQGSLDENGRSPNLWD